VPRILCPGGSWSQHHFDVFDGGRGVGASFASMMGPATAWFRGVSFQLTGGRSYRHAPTLDDVKAAFKSEYERSQTVSEHRGPCPHSRDLLPPSFCGEEALALFGLRHTRPIDSSH
jgi:hypothetical protein